MEQDTGVDLHFAVGKIKVSLGQALASNAHPRCIPMGSTPSAISKRKNHPPGWLFLLEQDTGVEPA